MKRLTIAGLALMATSGAITGAGLAARKAGSEVCPYGAVLTYSGGGPRCLSEEARHWLAEACYTGEQWACGERPDEHVAHGEDGPCELDPR